MLICKEFTVILEKTQLQNIQHKTTNNSIYGIINRGWLKMIGKKNHLIVYKNYSHSSYDMKILKLSIGNEIIN
jgi:hypothetical protein